MGQGALLAKVDIESAYCFIPVHPEDRPFLAMQWDRQVFIDPMLPFGLRSAPKIFNAVADALCWHLHRSGIPIIRHYLDNFIIVAPPGSSQCSSSLTILDWECHSLGVPIADHKRDGPTTCLTYLSIEIDTVEGRLRLPATKLHCLQGLLSAWGVKRACTRKELESLIGLLNHACKVVRSGRAFLRRMLDLLHAVHRPLNLQLPIRLNAGFRADLAWWQTFVAHWNGISFLNPPTRLPRVEFTSDASGSWGCGAWHGHEWFQVQWNPASVNFSIAEEFIPIILGCAAWGRGWRNHQMLCHCDNQVVVACLRSHTSRHKGIMHLLHCLVFVEATLGFYLVPLYISSKKKPFCRCTVPKQCLSLSFKGPSCQQNTDAGVSRAHPPAAGIASRLDLPNLEASAHRYFQAGLAPSTQSTYNAALKKFHAFCILYNIAAPFPVTERLLCYFIAYLADQGLSPQTGRVYLAALCGMQISLGLPDPREQSSLPILKRV